MSLRVSYVFTHVVLFLALGVLFERQAHAYTDPGSALLLFQGMSAFVTGAMFYFRRRLKGLFLRNRVSKDTKMAE